MSHFSRKSTSPSDMPPKLNEAEEQISDMLSRLKLLEGERKAAVEYKASQIKSNKSTLEMVKKENRELKEALSRLQKEQRGGKSRQERELEKLESRVNALRNELNELRFHNKQLSIEVSHKKDKFSDFQRQIPTEEAPMTQHIRILENRLDKAMIKYNEAQSIQKTYEQILKRLNQERLTFDNQLQALERTLKAKEHDYQELQNMCHEANCLKDSSKNEFLKAQQEFEDLKRQKEKDFKEKHQLVKSRLESTQFITQREMSKRRFDMDINGDMDDEGEERLRQTAHAQNLSTAANDSRLELENEKLAKLEETWRRLKDITGVNDQNEVIQKFLSSADNHSNLVSMTEEAQKKIESLNLKKKILKDNLEAIKYSQSTGLGSRRIIDEYESKLGEAKAAMERSKQQYERVAKIIINVKAGIEHLLDRLKIVEIHDDDSQNVSKRPPSVLQVSTASIDEEYIMDIVSYCEKKLVSVCKIVSGEQTEEAAKVVDDNSALQSSFVKQSDYNRRIKLEDESDSEYTSEEEEEEGDVLERKSIKKMAEQAVEKNRKKKKDGKQK